MTSLTMNKRRKPQPQSTNSNHGCRFGCEEKIVANFLSLTFLFFPLGKKNLEYSTFEDPKVLVSELKPLYKRLTDEKITVGQLYKVLVETNDYKNADEILQKVNANLPPPPN